jgi:hypothetical protein
MHLVDPQLALARPCAILFDLRPHLRALNRPKPRSRTANHFDGRPQLGFENELGSDRGVNTFQATWRAQDHRTAPRSNEPITARQVSQRVAVCGLGASANGPSAPARRKCARSPPCHDARARERGACRRRRASASPSMRRPCRRSRRAGVALSRFSGSAGRSR